MAKAKVEAKEVVKKQVKGVTNETLLETLNTQTEAINDQTEALRELTKVVGENTTESKRWFQAGHH